MKVLENIILILAIHISTCYAYFRISNYKIKNKLQLLILTIVIFALVTVQSILDIPYILKLILLCFTYSIVLSKITKINFEKSFIITVISIAISFIFSVIATPLTLIVTYYLGNKNYQSIIAIAFDSSIILLFTILLFKIKRFRNGFQFLKNQNKNIYLNSFILTLGLTIILIYFFILCFDHIPQSYLFFGVILFGIMLFIVLQQNIITYQTIKLQLKTLKEYEQELSDTKQKLETAIEEKQKLVQSNHEFYHRQEALNKKLDDLLIIQSHSADVEFGKEFGDIVNRINQMTTEYKSKTQTLPHLAKCGITEIDDMLSYMQLECYRNNIELIVKIDCDINHIINNYFSKSQIETLLGDLIRNAIIAINHSSEEFRSIMVVFGIKDDSYELCVYDSGIPFEINTLLNLGLKPSSTHLDEGGTGIGFITTFETINSCKASLVINELTNTQYTKSLEIKFDNKHQYIIVSNRKNEIEKLNIENRDIILM